MKLFVLLIGTTACCLIAAQQFIGPKSSYTIQTSDIPRFWQAFDSLRTANSTADSINLIQTLYLDKMSPEGQKFIEIREYTAAEYVRTIRKYPRYFNELRLKTAQLGAQRASIDSTFARLARGIPGYETPDVCFAIGCFRGGGTTRKNLILIGAEIALADSSMNSSEFKGNLRQIFANNAGLPALIAHESIHCQQHNGQNRTLLSIALQEGTADFLPALILHTNINKNVLEYGTLHECDLWQEFKPAINSTDLSAWLYNTGTSNNRPPDLGYFVGMRICEAYYQQQPDKAAAITALLNRSKYLDVLRQSNYNGNCKN